VSTASVARSATTANGETVSVACARQHRESENAQKGFELGSGANDSEQSD